MLFGSLSAVAHGFVTLVLFIVFGDMIDSFVTNEKDSGLNYTTLGLTEDEAKEDPAVLRWIHSYCIVNQRI